MHMPETTVRGSHATFEKYLQENTVRPLFLVGEARQVLSQLPNSSIDFCMTSPPYWGKREYRAGGIGLEDTAKRFIQNLLDVFQEVYRVLKDTGSFWLNVGDSYDDKALQGLPWRLALRMTDDQGWILRNNVIWHKLKGPDSSKDKLRNAHENVFHFVKERRGYYYDVDAVRSSPRKAKVKNGAIVSATGVTGVRYRRQIEMSTALEKMEKEKALNALDAELDKIRRGELSDFRMVIRKEQRTTHSNSEKVSGRAKQLQKEGFYFLRYHPKGSKPSDVWDILPEDTSNRPSHCAPYPEDLCKIPLKATCPPDGIALDPFCGIGTTNSVAQSFSRKSIGIDLSEQYIEAAQKRCHRIL